jgi:hypothetical protein
MQFATDELIARALLSFLVVFICFVPAMVDFNKTHATNPLWPAHARFHVVWQMSSYIIIGLISLFLLWLGGETSTLRLWIVFGLLTALILGFAAAVVAMPRYGGALADANGVPPFGTRVIAGRTVVFDANATLFSGFAVGLVAAALFAWF